MTRTIAERAGFIDELQRRLSGLDPDTAAWLEAQRIVIRARAEYWNTVAHQPRDLGARARGR